MEATLDDRGHLYLPQEVRERYGRRFRIVQLHDGIELIPLSEDPLESLTEALAPLGGLDPEEPSAVAEEEALEDLR